MHLAAAICLILVAAWIVLALFRPHQEYRVQASDTALDSPEFANMLESVCDSRIRYGNSMQVLVNGDVFYPAELQAIAQAQRSVNIEAYIFHRGEVADKYIAALTERARAGVKVRVVLDAVGSFSIGKHAFKSLIEAGGRVTWYHTLRWYSWDRFNNRTHRELTVIDGNKALIGGAGIADHWYKTEKEPQWRDTMVLVQGPAVNALQGTFAENWLEASGEVLAGADYYPVMPSDGGVPAMVVNSSAAVGSSNRARFLFQTLMASAKKTIYVQTPYFLPDVSERNELIRAAKRGVQVKVITPGKKSDHLLTRASSRRLFGDLLKNGIEIYEYQPAMIHAKVMLVDGVWSVVGSTNMDNRSFELNDEVNLAARDGAMSQQLLSDFERDLASSRRISYDEWQRRSWWERFTEFFGRFIERQE
jgi:cardiolipin synthase